MSRAFDGTRFIPGDVVVGDGHIVELGAGPARGERIAVPGFVDLQLNGFAGVDFQTAPPESIAAAGAALLAKGVTAYQPTVISAPVDSMVRTLRAIDEARRMSEAPHILPAHLEGPFLSPRWHGAHSIDHLVPPDRTVLDRLLAAGKVGYVTLAPELPGALEIVHQLRARSIVVALGHSDATAEQAKSAFEAGVSAVTHAYNAQRPFASREPGPVAAALADGTVWITAIADGIHLAPLTLALLVRAAGGRFVAISDGMTAAGLGDGHFRFGELEVTVRDGACCLAGGVLAGSTASLADELRQLVAVGVTLEESLAAITSHPAAVLGDRRLGVLAKGKPADVVVLDSHLHPTITLVGGAQVGEQAEVAAGGD